MREMGTGEFIVLLGGAALGAFAFLAISDFAIVRADWCIAGEADCLREWIGALSGWAAAIAAGATIYYLNGQRRDAQRQTAFLVGDASPSVELEASNKGFGKIDVVITNWNRRTIEVLDIVPGEGVFFGDAEFIDPYREGPRYGTFGVKGERPPTFTIAGWIDRAKPPPVVRVTIRAFKKKDGGIQSPVNVPLAASVKLRIFGSRYEWMQIDASKPEHLTL